MNQNAYRKLIAEKGGGLGKKLLISLLNSASLFYWAVVAIRNLCYDKGWLKTYRANAPVISVGNITTGGTGKTPLVIRICNLLNQRQIRPAILTRGYKTKKGKFADEPAILTKSCPNAAVLVNQNRVASANRAIGEFSAKVLIMDDGFQHRRLARDLDIVVIDATCPFGYGKLLPAGFLREPAGALKRADAAVITRCDQAAQPRLEQLEKKLRLINPSITIAKSIHTPVCAKFARNVTTPVSESQAATEHSSRQKKAAKSRLHRTKDKVELTNHESQSAHCELSLTELKDKKIFAFCGIGNPNAFLKTLKKLQLNVLTWKVYNDHHQYTTGDITDICEEARYLNADFILTTQKDWNKSALLAYGKENILFGYLVVKLEFIEGEDKIISLIDRTLNRLDNTSGY